MDDNHNYRIIILLAGLGMVLAALRVELTAGSPSPFLPLHLPTLHAAAPDARTSPRAALADDMQVFELSLFDGSPYSVEALHSVDQICRDHADDADIDRACQMFHEAAQPNADLHEIDDAVHLLKGG
jgi:hypothetical protein